MEIMISSILYGRINSKWLLENYTLIGAVIFLGRTVKKKRREEWSDNAIKAFRCNTGHFLSDHIFSSKDLTLNSTYLAATCKMFDSKFSTLKRSWFLFHQTSKHCIVLLGVLDFFSSPKQICSAAKTVFCPQYDSGNYLAWPWLWSLN